MTITNESILEEESLPREYIESIIFEELDADERREQTEYWKEIKSYLKSRPAGILLIRDHKDEGVEMVPWFLQDALHRACENYIVIAGDEGALLNTFGRRRWDTLFIRDLNFPRDNSWHCYIFTSKSKVNHWVAHIRLFSPKAAIGCIENGDARIVQCRTAKS